MYRIALYCNDTWGGGGAVVWWWWCGGGVVLYVMYLGDEFYFF